MHSILRCLLMCPTIAYTQVGYVILSARRCLGVGSHRMVEMGMLNCSETVWKVEPRDTQSAAWRSRPSLRRMRLLMPQSAAGGVGAAGALVSGARSAMVMTLTAGTTRGASVTSPPRTSTNGPDDDDCAESATDQCVTALLACRSLSAKLSVSHWQTYY